MNVLVIGKPKYNIILESESFPKENSKISVSEKMEISGGSSVYVACMLAKWGIPVTYIGSICGDEIGNKIKAELESFGVETKYIEVNYEHHSGLNYVLLNKSNGSSTEISHDNGVFLTKYKYDILPDYIITDGSDLGASIAASNNYPKAKMILLANKAKEEYIDLSKRCAYVCANIDFAQSLTKMNFEFNKSKTLVDLFQKIKDLNKAEYIIMLRDKGVLYTKERQVKMIPSISIEKKDDANSGSSFFGAYCYGILKGLDMDIVAKTSNIAGALALTKIGSLNTIPSKEEVFETAGVKDELVNNQEITTDVDTIDSNEKQAEQVRNDNINQSFQEPITNEVQKFDVVNQVSNNNAFQTNSKESLESNVPVQNTEILKTNIEGLSND